MMSVFYAHDSITRILIDHGADIRMPYPSGNSNCTILHMAAYMGSAAIVELLLIKDMDIEARDRYLQTPLHYAVKGANRFGERRNNGCARTVGVLLRNHANPEAENDEGHTPRSMASDYWNRLVNRLLDEGHEAQMALEELDTLAPE